MLCAYLVIRPAADFPQESARVASRSLHIFVVVDRLSSIRQHHAAGARPGARRSRLSIDLRAHGQALEAISQSLRMRLTTLVRTVIGNWLALRGAGGDGPSADASMHASFVARQGDGLAKLTLRLPAPLAARLAREARAAEMSPGLHVTQLLEGEAPTPVPADLKETRHALVSSTATLAALSSDLRALERSLSKVSWVDPAACSAVIEPLPAALSWHLALVSSALTA